MSKIGKAEARSTASRRRAGLLREGFSPRPKGGASEDTRGIRTMTSSLMPASGRLGPL